MLGLGTDRKVRRDRQSRGLCLAGAHAARARHHGGVRPAQEREREAARQRAGGGGKARRDAFCRTCPHAVLSGRHASFLSACARRTLLVRWMAATRPALTEWESNGVQSLRPLEQDRRRYWWFARSRPSDGAGFREGRSRRGDRKPQARAFSGWGEGCGGV